MHKVIPDCRLKKEIISSLFGTSSIFLLEVVTICDLKQKPLAEWYIIIITLFESNPDRWQQQATVTPQAQP